MRWSSIQERHPRLARAGRQRLIEPGVVLVATIRRDGTPRLSPVEPFLLDGELWLSMMPASTKVRDLDRDLDIEEALWPQSSRRSVIVMDEEARRRALYKQMEGRQRAARQSCTPDGRRWHRLK